MIINQFRCESKNKFDHEYGVHLLVNYTYYLFFEPILTHSITSVPVSYGFWLIVVEMVPVSVLVLLKFNSSSPRNKQRGNGSMAQDASWNFS